MKTITITVEVYDETTVEAIENIIDKVLNDAGIDCSYEVEEK